MVGLGLSSTTYVVVLGAVAQVVEPDRRSSAFGIVAAAGSFGTFALLPGVQWLITHENRQAAFPLMAALIGSVTVLEFSFPSRVGKPETKADPTDGTLLQAFEKARGHSGYWLLNVGFFVCGFHVSFIATHLPSFLIDGGLSPWVGATACR